jgi:hypothetical protein
MDNNSENKEVKPKMPEEQKDSFPEMKDALIKKEDETGKPTPEKESIKNSK